MSAGYMRKFGEMVFLYIVFMKNIVRVWRTHIQMNSETVPWVPIQSPIGGRRLFAKLLTEMPLGTLKNTKSTLKKFLRVDFGVFSHTIASRHERWAPHQVRCYDALLLLLHSLGVMPVMDLKMR